MTPGSQDLRPHDTPPGPGVHRMGLAQTTRREGLVLLLLWSAAVMLIALAWVHVSQLARESRANALSTAERDLGNLTRVGQEHANRTLRSADQVIRFIESRYLEIGDQLDIRDLTRQGVIDTEIFNQVGVIDEHGIYILSNQSQAGRIDLSDREHFKVHVAAESGRLFVSKPVLGRASGKWSIQLTRRITRPNGTFGGVVVVSIDPLYFTQFYGDLQLGPQGLAALYGLDGVARARRVGTRDEFGTNASASPMFSPGSGDLPAYAVTRRSVVDGVERMYHYRRIPGYQLAMVAGVDTDYLLASHRESRDALYLQAALVSLLILALAAALTQHLQHIRRDLTARRQTQRLVEERKEQLDAIFAMSPDGSQLYASLWLGQAVIGLSRDATTGRLSQPAGSGWCIADAPAPSGCTASASGAVSYPWSVAVSTDGTSVLVGGQSGYVVAFARDGVTGLLTERNCLQDQAQTPTNANCATAYGVGQADGVAISPDGLNGYVAGGTQLATMSINPQTAAITQLPGTAGCIWATGTGPECAEWDNADFGTTLAFSANGEDLYSASMSTLTQLRRPPARALVVSRSGTGTGAVASSPSGIDCGMTCTGTFADGTTAVLTATPQSGSSFAGWTGDCSGSAPACTVTMDGAKTATARFDPVPVVPAPGEATAPAEATEAPTASTSVPATLTVDSAAARVAGPVVELALPSAGKVTVVGTSAGVRSAVCAGTRTVRTGGTYHVGCTLTPAGRRVVSRHSIRVALRVAFAPTGGTREVQRTTVVMPRRAPHIVVTG